VECSHLCGSVGPDDGLALDGLQALRASLLSLALLFAGLRAGALAIIVLVYRHRLRPRQQRNRETARGGVHGGASTAGQTPGASPDAGKEEACNAARRCTGARCRYNASKRHPLPDLCRVSACHTD
jgi:hypothetical protein